MKDLSNQRFGRLVAIKPCGKNKYRNVLWLCRCDCGKEHIVPSGKLLQGKSKSCGCYAHDLHVAQLEKHGITTGIGVQEASIVAAANMMMISASYFWFRWLLKRNA